MNPQDFQYIAQVLKDRSGLVLREEKAYLLESRLMPITRKYKLETVEALIADVRKSGDEEKLGAIIEAMTTNESFFFRDIKPFDNFREIVLPKLVAARKASGRARLRIWSAACSSGQEPYSLAMIIGENPQICNGMEIEIIGTDLSHEILQKAKTGSYSQFEVQRGLPIQMLMKYFSKEGDDWIIKDSIKSMVKFRPFNLLDKYGALGQFDVIFCRNVLIYFDQPTKSDILSRLCGQMPDDGVLFLGGAESVIGLSDALQPISGLRGVYEQAKVTAQPLAAAGAA